MFGIVWITSHLFQSVVEAWWGWLGAACVVPAFSERCRIMRIMRILKIMRIIRIRMAMLMLIMKGTLQYQAFFQGRSGLLSRRHGVIWRCNIDIGKPSIFIYNVGVWYDIFINLFHSAVLRCKCGTLHKSSHPASGLQVQLFSSFFLRLPSL